MCYGIGKVDMARRFLSGSGYGLDQAAFYSDSHADLPLLEQVGFPVVLNPTQILADVAQERNWPVLDWRENVS